MGDCREGLPDLRQEGPYAVDGLPLRAGIREMVSQTQENFEVSPPRKMEEQKQAEAWTLNLFDTLKREL